MAVYFTFVFIGDLGPVYMEWGTPVWWGRFLLFCVPQSVKTKETNPTRPGSPTPCKQTLNPLGRGGGLFPVMAYTKGAPFQASGIKKGRDLTN